MHLSHGQSAGFGTTSSSASHPDAGDMPYRLSPLASRVHAEFREMPGMRLTARQAQRLFGITPEEANDVLDELRRASMLAQGADGMFALTCCPAPIRQLVPQARSRVTEERLVALLRHWTWTDNAAATLERALTAVGRGAGTIDHAFGAYCHWCALLCAFGEAALDGQLLTPSQVASLRSDLDASMPTLRACRQLLAVIPPSLEEHARITRLLRNGDMVPRLRRVHRAFGNALRDEQAAAQVARLGA